MVFTGVESLTALIAGGVRLKRPHPLHRKAAMAATVGKFARHAFSIKRQFVKGWLTRNSKVGAGLLPLDAMRLNASASAAPVSQQVRGFVLHGAPYLSGAEVFNERVQFNNSRARTGSAGGCLKPRIPHYHGLLREQRRTDRKEPLMHFCRE